MIYGAITNLHVTLIGDRARAGSYLPYGKQLVRRLMSEGRYANSTDVYPADGVFVEAWILGEQRWVRITVLECPSIFMDSGIVSLHNIGFTNPELTKNDGTLHYNNTLREEYSVKRLLGKIKPPSVTCVPSEELKVSKAFAAELDKEGIRDSSSEGVLAAKKYTAARIPPSLFTGKLRLYIQSHYGRELSAWKFRANVANQPPSLDLDMTNGGGDAVTFQFNSAHTGIFTDEDENHWLVQLGIKGAYAAPNTVNIFPLRPSPCVEKLRSILRLPDTPEKEKELTEAYLLSQSYPDWDSCISVQCAVPLNVSLGYGWHFNWSGDKADIISMIRADTGTITYVSTHYRITIVRNDTYIDDPTNTPLQNEARRWSANLSVVEEKSWKNAKWNNVIASPDWDSGYLSIFGEVLGEAFGVDAPVYCFYTKNDLQVVRYSYSGGDACSEQMTVSTPAYFGGNAGWGVYPGTQPCPLYTIGLEEGVSEGRSRTTKPQATSFSVGDTAVSGSSNSYTGVKFISGKKDIVESAWTYPYYGELSVWVGPIEVTESTVFSCVLSYAFPTSVYVGFGQFSNSIYIYVNYTCTTTTFTHSESTKTLCVVPFGDAEAVYLWGQKWVGETHSGDIKEQRSGDYVSGVRDTKGGEWLWYPGGDHFGGDVVGDAGSESSVYSTIGSYFISNSGSQPFVPEQSIAGFFVGEPTVLVPQNFWTRTSAGTPNVSDGNGVNIPDSSGYNAALNGQVYVFVGAG